MAKAKQELTDTRVQGRPDQRAGNLTSVDPVEDIDNVDGHGNGDTRIDGPLRPEKEGLRKIAAAAAKRMRAEQGLPPRIDDPATLSRVATLLQANDED